MAGMLADLQHALDDATKIAATEVWPLGDDELTESLQAAYRLEQAFAVLQVRLVQQAETRNLPATRGHRRTAGWLREVLLLDPSPARDLSAHATTLSPALQQAVLDGQASLRQAAVIATTVQAIPDGLADLDQVSVSEAAEIAQRAEHTMLAMAGRLAACQLTRIGERILAHVAPHLAEQADEAALNRQEARARLRRGFTMSLPVDGLVRLSGHLGLENAAIVQSALHPLCTPASVHDRTPDFGDDRTPAQQRADALVDVCRLALRTGDLPADGGEPPQLAVTVAYDPLARCLGVGITDTGWRLSPAAVRRSACDARVLPVVLGSAGQVLDAGRARRLATGTLRRALTVRDGGCSWPDCDRPPRWTDAHHIIAWTDGGPTNLDNLVLLCGRHHHLIHADSGWQIRLGADSRPDFIPPPEIDPQQQSRRNLYHLRR